MSRRTTRGLNRGNIFTITSYDGESGYVKDRFGASDNLDYPVGEADGAKYLHTPEREIYRVIREYPDRSEAQAVRITDERKISELLKKLEAHARGK